MELRELIADEISDIHDPRSRDEMLEAADRILRIPRIAEALKHRAIATEFRHHQPNDGE